MTGSNPTVPENRGRHTDRGRILLICHEFHPYAGGIGTLAHGLAIGAARRGYAVHVLAPSYHQDTAAVDARCPYQVVRFPGDRFRYRYPHRVVGFTRSVWRLSRELRPDLIHAVDIPGQLALGTLASRRRRPLVGVTVCGSDLLLYRRAWPLRVLFERAVAATPIVFAISRHVAELFAQVVPAAAEKVVVSNPGISPRWFEEETGSQMADVRRRAGAVPGDRVVVTVARRVPEKGQLEVLAALGLLAETERGRLRYFIIGTGPDAYAEAIRTEAARLGVKIWMPGFLSDADVAAVYDIADLHVMLSEDRPGRVEGYGLTYLEAAARGVPSIARDVGGVRDVVLDGSTGIVVPRSASPSVVVGALRRLLADGVARRAMGAAARAHALQFTWERDATRVFDRLLGQGHGRPGADELRVVGTDR